MTVVVTPLSGSEKLRLREVFASVQDSGSLSGYIRTYGIDSRSVSKLESFIMENELLDRVEGNANVHRWSEQTQLEKGDSIAAGYMSELSGYTRISVTQNNLRSLRRFGINGVTRLNSYSTLFHFWGGRLSAYRRGVHCLVTLSQVPGMSEQWITIKIKEKGECKYISWDALKGLILTHPDEAKMVDVFFLSLYGLMVFPRALGYVDEATTDLFHRLSKRVTSVPAILAETFRSLGTCRKAGVGRFVGCAQLLLAWFYSHFWLIDKVVCRVFFEDYLPLKDIVTSSRRVDVPEENWMALLQNLQSKDVEWRAPWMIPGEILYRCCSFDWVPLLGIWGAIGYTPLLVLRQFGLRQFVPATHRLTQSEFAYRGVDYKKRVEYVEWRGRRINDNIPEPNMEGARPMEEYLQVIPSELEIMKQEFERKNLELEKRIAKLEEEKMYLSLDIDVQKMEVEKERKEKRKIEEDRDDLKEHYKKAQVSLRRAKVGGSSDQLQKEVQEGKARAEYWEKKFQEMQSQNLALEKENKRLKSKITELGRSPRWHRNHDSTVELKEGELHQSRGQIRERDHVMGEAKAQIREVAEYVQDLAVRADNEMREQMMEAQRNMMAEMAQLLRATDKGKAPMAITEEENEGPPSGFTPPHIPLQTEAPPRRPSTTVRP
ncbi:hypothetical protein CXB51_024441 [Gossypium anomalum]|uniref:DUF7745 domain-containing protein n=1 Tax=Gossypium anomalum TaxID=47600 RepID=A0A8J6CS79_9ROSI|nr:hypothetical protein CXB51_024441 [Gossypium anomalum]